MEARVRPLGEHACVGMYRVTGGKLVAWNQALTSDMVFNQPVIYEMEQITVPTRADDRPEGHDRHRQGSRAARDRQDARATTPSSGRKAHERIKDR